uniref:Uncharacterized protein n=1 Tax=Siphoviridae sp. ctn8e14 TaxID=2827936 RepID=A0A8S5T5A0_9CAUD|nr:MAG TPA: hypothetical protein [Siphoviridae sp. ctn8e14]
MLCYKYKLNKNQRFNLAVLISINLIYNKNMN